MRRLRSTLAATAVAAAALLVGAPTAAAPDTVDMGDVFGPFVLDTFRDGRIAPPEQWRPRHPVTDPWFQAPPVADLAPERCSRPARRPSRCTACSRRTCAGTN